MNNRPKDLNEVIEMSKHSVLTSTTQYTLNIGLVASHKFDALRQSRCISVDIIESGAWAQHAKDLLAYHVATNIVKKIERKLNLNSVDYWRIEQSDSEPTLVVVLDITDTYRVNTFYTQVKALADYYAQDCIAVRNDSTMTGVLIGAYADDWGKFDPEYFISH